jgi:N-acetylglucosamine-6-phosphate deacetylase
MQQAMENGCNLVTHLYSCTSTITRKQGFRRLGVLETAMLHDELYAEIIADGCHLPPELIRLIVKIKGVDRLALITDSLAVAGTGITEGFSLGTAYIIEDGVCKLADRSAFAGSIATADMLIRVVTQKAGLSLTDAVHMMTAVPARIMGLNKGILAPGKDADIVAFDDNINITAAFVMGKKVI